MNIGKTLFAQIMDFLPWKTFHRTVKRYDGNRRVRTLSCAEQFRCMAFAQLTYRESLRDEPGHPQIMVDFLARAGLISDDEQAGRLANYRHDLSTKGNCTTGSARVLPCRHPMCAACISLWY